METILTAFFIIIFLILLIITVTASGYICVGTISKETINSKFDLRRKDFEIIHADDFRNQGYNHKKAGRKALLKFILDLLSLKKVALFTSNPYFLYLKYFLFLTPSIKVKDLRSDREENIRWVSAFMNNQALHHIPKYFEGDTVFNKGIYGEIDRGTKRVRVLIEELKRYPDNRFKKNKKQITFRQREETVED